MINRISRKHLIRSLRLRVGPVFLLSCLLFCDSQTSSFAQGTGSPQHLREIELHIDKATLETQVAATPQQQEIGLMYVTKLPDNDGMIFLLPQIEQATFWMKNTLIPLSIAYIDRDGVILDIHDMQPGDPNLPDKDLPVTISNTGRTAYALEANLHWFALNGIKPGDKILPPPSTWAKPVP